MTLIAVEEPLATVGCTVGVAAAGSTVPGMSRLWAAGACGRPGQTARWAHESRVSPCVWCTPPRPRDGLGCTGAAHNVIGVDAHT